MTFIEGFDKKIKEIEKDESKFDKTMKSIISALDKLEKSKVGDAAYKAAQLMSKELNMLLAVGKVPSSVKQAIYKEANGQFERALKGYLRFKPAKEGMEVEEPATESLLEQAMKLFV
jgi:CRISPR/Cas system endoribonuclease Cas6 (RAMP superfamily)